MLRRLLIVCLLPLMLSGCIKAKLASMVDHKGNVESEAEIVTSMLVVGMFDAPIRNLRAQGIAVNVDTRDDGMVAIRWKQKGFPFFDGKWECKGLFTTECTYSFRDTMPNLTAQQQAVMSAVRKGKDGKNFVPEIKMLVVLPKGAKIKSSDADKVFEDADGVNLLWIIDPYRTGVVQTNFTVKL